MVEVGDHRGVGCLWLSSLPIGSPWRLLLGELATVQIDELLWRGEVSVWNRRRDVEKEWLCCILTDEIQGFLEENRVVVGCAILTLVSRHREGLSVFVHRHRVMPMCGGMAYKADKVVKAFAVWMATIIDIAR